MIKYIISCLHFIRKKFYHTLCCMRLPVFHFIMPVSHGFYVMRTMGHVLTPKLFLSMGFSNLTVATSPDLVFYLSQ